jgi:hypothetical protein
MVVYSRESEWPNHPAPGKTGITFPETANEFGNYLEVRPSAPECTRVHPKEQTGCQIFGDCLVSASRKA